MATMGTDGLGRLRPCRSSGMAWLWYKSEFRGAPAQTGVGYFTMRNKT